jgi:hypothetical protein
VVLVVVLDGLRASIAGNLSRILETVLLFLSAHDVSGALDAAFVARSFVKVNLLPPLILSPHEALEYALYNVLVCIVV